jgi:hypothetical protein
LALPGNARGKGVFSTSIIWGQLGRESKRSLVFELARVLVRLDHVARFIVNADHRMM